LETRENRDESLLRLSQKVENARHELALAQGEIEDLEDKLREKQKQLYDVQQLVLQVSDRLIARERHSSDDSVEEQLAEARRFITSAGGQLRDGAKGTVEQARRRSRLN
jgi:predicted  nucleic acid-binding Zn-ribbon protein